jgi:hypothetical protein
MITASVDRKSSKRPAVLRERLAFFFFGFSSQHSSFFVNYFVFSGLSPFPVIPLFVRPAFQKTLDTISGSLYLTDWLNTTCLPIILLPPLLPWPTPLAAPFLRT